MTDEQARFTAENFAWEDPQWEEALRIRNTVFVDEQKVPEDKEVDEKDRTAHHVLIRSAGGVPRATGRLTPENSAGGVVRIGRVAVLKESRGTGAGRAVMEHLIAHARQEGCAQIVLDSQVHALPFYERFGFRAAGGTFMEADIPHRRMILDPKKG